MRTSDSVLSRVRSKPHDFALGALTLHPSAVYNIRFIPVVRMMFRKKAKSRFEYFFARHRTINLKRWSCPSTNDEPTAFFREDLGWHHHSSMGTGGLEFFSMSCKKIFKALSQPNRNVILTNGIILTFPVVTQDFGGSYDR